MSASRTGVRWLKFNAVGAGGIVVQLAALTLLKSGLAHGLPCGHRSGG